MSFSLVTPSSRYFYTLNTEANFCIVACMLLLTWATEYALLVANLSWSNLWITSSPAPLGRSGCFYPGYDFSFAKNAAYLPKMTRSRRLLAPSLLAP
jgi:hypothetical protein